MSGRKSEENRKSGPLQGIRVVDVSQLMAGPYCGMRLGDLGAEVIKIEPPRGEWVRQRGFGDFRLGEETIAYLALNRSKRSVTLNLKHEDGKAAIYELIKQSDVFIQNFRVGTAERLGIGYEQLKEINPRLIYCSVSGFGETGPYAHKPSQDLIAQGLSGGMRISGSRKNLPTASVYWPSDMMTSLFATIGVLAALVARDKTGEGQKVESNLLASLLESENQEVMASLLGFTDMHRPESPCSAHALFDAPYGVFETADSYLTIGTVPVPAMGEALNDDRLRELSGRRDGFEHRDEIFSIISRILKTRTTAEWLDVFEKHDIWSGPVYSFEEMAKDPHIKETGMLTSVEREDLGTIPMTNVPLHFSKTPAGIQCAPPKLGEFTEEALRSLLGYTQEKIEQLRADGTIL